MQYLLISYSTGAGHFYLLPKYCQINLSLSFSYSKGPYLMEGGVFTYLPTTPTSYYPPSYFTTHPPEYSNNEQVYSSTRPHQKTIMVYGFLGLKNWSERYFFNVIFKKKIWNGKRFWSERKYLF